VRVRACVYINVCAYASILLESRSITNKENFTCTKIQAILIVKGNNKNLRSLIGTNLNTCTLVDTLLKIYPINAPRGKVCIKLYARAQFSSL